MMKVTLDGQVLFEQTDIQIEPGSLSRDARERAVPGLDGLLSIDLGKRSRKIKQLGMLRAKSRSQLRDKINDISGFLDGRTHTLVIDDESFEHLRMDTLKVSNERVSGTGLVTDYEIVYTQLRF